MVGGLGLSLGVNVATPTADLPRSVSTARGEVVQAAVLVNAFESFCTFHDYAFASARCSVNVFGTKPTMNSSPPSRLTVSSS